MRHLFCYLALIFAVTRPEITSCDKENYKEEPRTYDNITETEAKTSEGYNVDKIVGGTIAKRGEFPWVLGLWRYKGRRPTCGASLLNKRWALTAAHCVRTYPKKPKNLNVVAGDFDVKKKETGEKEMKVCSVHMHPGYSKKPKNVNDIALLRLCEDVTYSRYIAPITLPSKGLNVPDDASVTVAGWGRTTEGGSTSDKLRKVYLKKTNLSFCKNRYNSVGNGHICAGIKAGGKDACQGDSGGPLWYRAKGKTFQVGVVSFGGGCARPNTPGVYTSVPYYRTWINKIMQRKYEPDN